MINELLAETRRHLQSAGGRQAGFWHPIPEDEMR